MIRLTLVKYLPATARINRLVYSTVSLLFCKPSRFAKMFRAALGYVVTNHHHFNLLLFARDYKLGTANLGESFL